MDAAEEDEDTLYDDVFPIHSTIKEIDYSRGNTESYVPFLNKLLIVLPSPYVEDEDALDTELV